mmetsp:Transcript_5005/g.10816  ORF Transcript_5005/g.10816 Transcript_5005/m.10816 type:complete len:127 (+) Transcript_5005:199-579(+)
MLRSPAVAFGIAPAKRVCCRRGTSQGSTRPSTRAAAPRHSAVKNRSLTCRANAEYKPAPKQSKQPGEVIDAFLKKYDVVSAMMGSLVVTSFCWSRGQDPITALGITMTSTVVALVANEIFFSSDTE